MNPYNAASLTIAVCSDLQTNSTVGLCPPIIELDDGGSYRSSRGQRWLWHNWCDFIERAEGYKQQGDLWVVLDGDLGDGDHHDTTQIITRNKNTMRKIAADTIDPLAKLASKLFVIRGTEAHVGKSASFEEQLAEDFGAEMDGKNYSWWWLVANWRGVKVDIAHHCSMGAAPVARGNAANKLAVETIFDYADRREIPPDLVLRAHVHRHADSGSQYSVRAVILPCWQFATAYIYKLKAGSLPSIGGVFIHIDQGRFSIEDAIYRPERKAVWKE